jgi:hypothetical protein
MRYTLALQRGVFIVGKEDIDRLIEAKETGKPLLTVKADPFGVDENRVTTVAVSAVQYWTETPEAEAVAMDDDKVLMLRRVRRGGGCRGEPGWLT